VSPVGRWADSGKDSDLRVDDGAQVGQAEDARRPERSPEGKPVGSQRRWGERRRSKVRILSPRPNGRQGSHQLPGCPFGWYSTRIRTFNRPKRTDRASAGRTASGAVPAGDARAQRGRGASKANQDPNPLAPARTTESVINGLRLG